MDIVLASHNQQKLDEFRSLFKDLPVHLSFCGDYGVPEPEETGVTFLENALLKARWSFEKLKKPVLADDSGLCLHALQDQPGIYSARWAGPNKDFASAAKRIYDELKGKDDTSCHFACALAFITASGEEYTSTGRIDGNFVYPGRGKIGLGYDSFFLPHGHNQTFGEMIVEKKESICHRTLAFQELIPHILKNNYLGS